MLQTENKVRTEWAETNPLLRQYYDSEWGIPVYGEHEIFERLSLEGFQSGLSWLTVLKKRDAFREVFSGFNPDKVAAYDETDIERLLQDPRIIRNSSKIRAVINNAKATLRLRDSTEHSGLPSLIWSFMPQESPTFATNAEMPTASAESEAMAKELKKNGFTFIGPTTAYATMAAIGMVDLHIESSFRRGCSGLWSRDGKRIKDPQLLR